VWGASSNEIVADATKEINVQNGVGDSYIQFFDEHGIIKQLIAVTIDVTPQSSDVVVYNNDLFWGV
jgi:hypothetical protein